MNLKNYQHVPNPACAERGDLLIDKRYQCQRPLLQQCPPFEG